GILGFSTFPFTPASGLGARCSGHVALHGAGLKSDRAELGHPILARLLEKVFGHKPSVITETKATFRIIVGGNPEGHRCHTYSHLILPAFPRHTSAHHFRFAFHALPLGPTRVSGCR